MASSSVAGSWADVLTRFRDTSAYRSWTIEANDGIIATAGLLFGFAGAGASNRVLLFTAAAATIAGGLSVGGASWAGEAAEEVARQLTEHDALAAQLEWEYRFDTPMPATFPIWFGVGAGLAYMVGALVPLLITYFAPVAVEPWAILAAVIITLVLSSLVAARTAELLPRRMLARTLVVGVLTLAVSYAAGELLL